jgi:hypothetical protein
VSTIKHPVTALRRQLADLGYTLKPLPTIPRRWLVIFNRSGEVVPYDRPRGLKLAELPEFLKMVTATNLGEIHWEKKFRQDDK